MIDRSESHLIAREQRNRGDASNRDTPASAARARRTAMRAAHESARAQRVEPSIADPAKSLATKQPR